MARFLSVDRTAGRRRICINVEPRLHVAVEKIFVRKYASAAQAVQTAHTAYTEYASVDVINRGIFYRGTTEILACCSHCTLLRFLDFIVIDFSLF